MSYGFEEYGLGGLFGGIGKGCGGGLDFLFPLLFLTGLGDGCDDGPYRDHCGCGCRRRCHRRRYC